MNKKLLPLALVIISVVLLCPVSVYGTTEVMQAGSRGANATWADGTFALVMANNKETQMGKIIVVVFGPSIMFGGALAPSELKWSMDMVWVSTEFNATHTLAIEWETVSPTTLTHTNDFDYMGEIHLVHNGAMRLASATLMMIDSLGNIVLTLEDGFGAVSEGIRVEITAP